MATVHGPYCIKSKNMVKIKGAGPILGSRQTGFSDYSAGS
jgi:hypothetical protein